MPHFGSIYRQNINKKLSTHFSVVRNLQLPVGKKCSFLPPSNILTHDAAVQQLLCGELQIMGKIQNYLPRRILAGVSGGSQNETRVSSDRRMHGMMRMIM